MDTEPETSPAPRRLRQRERKFLAHRRALRCARDPEYQAGVKRLRRAMVGPVLHSMRLRDGAKERARRVVNAPRRSAPRARAPRPTSKRTTSTGESTSGASDGEPPAPEPPPASGGAITRDRIVMPPRPERGGRHDG